MRRVVPILGLVVLLSACGPSKGVELRTVDGLGLRGYEFGDGDRVVILAHDPSESPGVLYSFARRLSSKGYRVLTLQYRGRGGSQGAVDPQLAPRDVESAIEYARTTEARQIGVVGFDRGGAAALAALPEAQVDAIAVVSAPLAYGLDDPFALLRVDASKLFVASLRDSEAADDAGELLKLSKDPEAQIRILPGDARGTDILLGRRGKEAIVVLERFLAEELG